MPLICVRRAGAQEGDPIAAEWQLSVGPDA
jgi:hypothetical protein